MSHSSAASLPGYAMLYSFALQIALAASSLALQGPQIHDGLISFPATRKVKPVDIVKRDGDVSAPLLDESGVSYLVECE